MTDDKADLLQRFLTWSRFLVPLIGILLVTLQWWQNSLLMDEGRSANQTMRQIWTDHPAEFPFDTLAASLFLPTAVSPLGAFDPGDGPWLAQTIWLQVSKSSRGQDQIGFDVFPAGRQSNLSAAAFTQIVIPALALLIAWRHARKSRSLSLQSWSSVQTALMEYAGPTIAICCMLTAILHRQSLGSEGAIRLMLILGAYVLYSLAAGTVCWLAFQLIDDIPRASGILVLFWLFNLTLARPLTVNIASALAPLPTLDSYVKRIDFESRNGYNGVESREDRQRRFFNEILRDYNATTPDKVPVNVSALVLQREELHQRQVASRLKEELNQIFATQERLEQIMSMALPSVAIQICSSALSATDFASERRQLLDADLYWDQIVKRVYNDVAVSSGPTAQKVLRGRDYWSQFPYLESSIPSPFWAVFTCLTPACGLLLFGLGGTLSTLKSRKAVEEATA